MSASKRERPRVRSVCLCLSTPSGRRRRDGPIFQEYAETFEKRGQQYHQAMLNQPRARDEEFENLVRFADLRGSQRVCDCPSGGGYLREYVPPGVDLISVEDSAVFARLAQSNGTENLMRSKLLELAVQDNCFDRVVSLAALHHVEDKGIFYREAGRVLRPEGMLCVADVWAGSGVAGFLNVFVHENNPMGHEGKFLDEGAAAEFEAAGLRVIEQQRVPFFWHFRTEREMTEFCSLLFGAEGATHDETLAAIDRYLGFEAVEGGFRLRWELAFFNAVLDA